MKTKLSARRLIRSILMFTGCICLLRGLSANADIVIDVYSDDGTTSHINVGESVRFTSSDPYDDPQGDDDYPFDGSVDSRSFGLSDIYDPNDTSTFYNHAFALSGSYLWKSTDANGAKTSGTIEVDAPQLPTLSDVSPNPAGGSPDPQTITLTGQNLSGASVTLTSSLGTILTPNATGSDTLLAVSAILGNDAADWTVKVTTPGGSDSRDFLVSEAIPEITSLDPDSTLLGPQPNLVLTFTGSGFGEETIVTFGTDTLPGSAVTVNDEGTVLKAVVPATDVTSLGAVTVTLENPPFPGPGGDSGQSCSSIFTVNAQPLGIDVSSHNMPVEWDQVALAGKTFAFVKASEGTSCGPYNYVSQSLIDAQDNTLTVGVYHFAEIFAVTTPQVITVSCPRTRSSYNSANAVVLNARDEANNFLTLAGQYVGSPYLPPVLDVDVNYSDYGLDSAAELAQWIQTWIDTVQAAAPGITPIIYANKDTISSLMQTTPVVADGYYPLFIASYDCNPVTSPVLHGTVLTDD